MASESNVGERAHLVWGEGHESWTPIDSLLFRVWLTEGLKQEPRKVLNLESYLLLNKAVLAQKVPPKSAKDCERKAGLVGGYKCSFSKKLEL